MGFKSGPVGRHQRAGGAGLHTFAAPDAAALSHGVVDIEHYAGTSAAARITDHIVCLNFAAGAQAAGALDAGIKL